MPFLLWYKEISNYVSVTPPWDRECKAKHPRPPGPPLVCQTQHQRPPPHVISVSSLKCSSLRESAVRARGAVVLRGGTWGCAPLWGQRKGVPTSCWGVPAWSHSRSSMPPLAPVQKSNGLCRDTKVPPGSRGSAGLSCSPSLWGVSQRVHPLPDPSHPSMTPWSQQPAHSLASSPVPGSQADP